MKTFSAVLLALVTVAAAADEKPHSTVRFSNNDRLSGNLESLSPELLTLSSPVLEKSAPFLLKHVIDITLPATEPKLEDADHTATVTLKRGGTLRGQLASVTDETITLDTWYAGRLLINRLMVTNLAIEGRSASIYRGPTGLDGWVQTGEKGAWTYANSAFRSNARGSIAREKLLPDQCSVAFDVAWKGDAMSLKVALFSDDATTENPQSGYELTFQRGSIYLRNCKTQAFLGNANSQSMMENDRVRVEIRASRSAGRVALFIDGKILEDWTDPDAKKGAFGDVLHFVSHNSMPMRISNIRITDWNGVIDERPEPRLGFVQPFGPRDEPEETDNSTTKPAEDNRMELSNGDTIHGEMTAIKDGVITIKSTLGELNLPVARFRTLALKPVPLEESIRLKGDIQAWFPDGSSVIFRLDEVGADSLTGYSQNFGNATFKLAAFSRIEFNIYDPELAERRETEEW